MVTNKYCDRELGFAINDSSSNSHLGCVLERERVLFNVLRLDGAGCSAAARWAESREKNEQLEATTIRSWTKRSFAQLADNRKFLLDIWVKLWYAYFTDVGNFCPENINTYHEGCSAATFRPLDLWLQRSDHIFWPITLVRVLCFDEFLESTDVYYSYLINSVDFKTKDAH